MKRLAFIAGQSIFLSLLFTAAWLCAATAVFSALPGWNTYAISSGSMSPTLDVGDVVVSRTNTQDIKPGDVVTFHRGGNVFTHRVHSEQSGLIITKGDANPTADSDPLTKSNVIGKAYLVLPGAGLLSTWIESENYVALGITSLVLAVSFWFLRTPNFLREATEIISPAKNRHRVSCGSVLLSDVIRSLRKRKSSARHV